MANHYSDAQLLSLLDGECSHFEKAKSRFHLRRCWACRGRMAELEASAHRFALALQRDDYPGRDRVDRAKQDFLNRITAGEESAGSHLQLPPSLGRHRAAWLSPALGAGLVLAASGTVGFLVLHDTSTPRRPQNIPSRFSPPAISIGPAPRTTPEVVMAKPPEVKSPATSVPDIATPLQLEAAEIEARYALHRANLDLSPVEYLHELGGLTILGFSRDQAEALDYLGKRGFVRLRFEAPAPLEGAITRLDIHVASEHAPIEARLGAWFAKQPFPSQDDRNRSYAAYLNEMVSLATKAKRAATALQRLAVRYQATPLPQLPAEHRWLLEAMIRDHLSTLDITTERERLLLDQVFPGDGAVLESRSLGQLTWSEVCQQLFADVSAAQSLIVELFSSRDPVNQNVSESIARIQNRISQWPSRRTEAEQVISRQFNSTEEKP